MKTILFSLFVASFAQAQVVKKNLYRKPVEVSAVSKEVATGKPISKSGPPAPRRPEVGNLPSVYLYRMKEPSFAENPIVLPPKSQKAVFEKLRVGDIVTARIDGGILAFPDSKLPVRAVVNRGILMGSIFIGEATMEKNSKRIVIQFNRFRPDREKASYSTVGYAFSKDGILGLEGKYESGEVKYFTAEMLAAFASGYADSLVERAKSPFGQTIEEPSVANAGRKATANAMSRTADRFAEKVRSASEFVTLMGPVTIDILIQDQPILQN